MVGCLICGAVALGCWILSFRHFRERGFLFNNAYLYASPEERKTMEKRPYYRQTAVAFLLLGAVFAANALEFLLKTGWLSVIAMVLTATTVVYAVVSTVLIEKKR